MKYEKYIKYAFIIGCIILLLYFMPTLLHLFMPFILAVVVAAPFHRFVDFLHSRLHIHRSIISVIIFTLIIGVIVSVVGLIIYYIAGQFRNFLTVIPENMEAFQSIFSEYYERFRNFAPKIAGFIDNYLNNKSSSVNTYAPKLTEGFISYATNFAASIPSALFFLLIFLLSVFFFIKDYNSIVQFIKEALPESVVSKISYLKSTAWNGFVGYIKSQVILSSITALLVLVTFWVLGIDYAIVWAIIVGVIDFIPIFGSGIVLVPYAIFHFITNNSVFLALCIIVLQIVAFVVRQVLSPKIMSSQLGLHPILTLISIYVGNELMGVLGMIVFPIFAILIVSLYKSYKDADFFR